jgi:glycosyltransferase involved in cell wall biosynthesis
MLRRARTRDDRHQADIVFVVSSGNKGWILEAICNEIANVFDGSVLFHDGKGPLPAARAYFFSHFSLFIGCRKDAALKRRTSVVWFTHPNYPPAEAPFVAKCLRRATKVISTSSTHVPALIEAGLPANNIDVVLPGADPQKFRSHKRSGRAVGFCSAYYDRKSPSIIVGLVRSMPHRNFSLLGRNWREAPEFGLLESLDNFTYLESSYDAYPAFYDSVDVFVSPSRIEGGPIPLLEAMMANVVPVATRTGFAPDLIDHGVNGFLCDVDAPLDNYCQLVEQAFALEADVHATVAHLTWDRFARTVLAVLSP